MSWSDDLERLEPLMHHIVNEAHIWIGEANSAVRKRDEMLAEAFALLEAFAKDEPSGYGAESSTRYCAYCGAREDEEYPIPHIPACPWLKSRAFLAQHTESEETK